MKLKTLALVLLLVASPNLWAAGGGGFPHDTFAVDISNKGALQRGARLYVNYCMGCHSLEFQRYSRLAADAGIDEKTLIDNLIFDPAAKPGSLMTIPMDSDSAEKWFNAVPPDLTVIARSRGTDFLYNYMRAFHLDPSTPMGVNNSIRTVSMPHALWELEGWKKAVYDESATDAAGNSVKKIIGFEMVQTGALTATEYDAAVGDLITFLSYVGEPIQLERQRIGVWVLFFLILAAILFYMLKKEYWRDVH